MSDRPTDRCRFSDRRSGFWRSFGAAFALLFGCLISGCSSRYDSSQVTINFWAIGREGEVLAQMLPGFERSHPGVHVEVQQIPLLAAHEKLLTAFAGDALPDMAQLGNTWVPEFATLGALEPLQPYVDASTVVHPSDYFSGIWDTNLIDGRLYGVPWYIDTRLLFYRTDLLVAAGFDHPPRDWDEWRRQMAAIKARVGKEGYAIYMPLNEFEPLLGLALQQPEALLRDDNTRGNFATSGFRRALSFYAEMFRKGWAPPITNTQMSNVWDEFGKGYFVFYITGPWTIGEFDRRLPASLKGRWDTAPLPSHDGHGGGAAGGSSFVVFRSSAHKQVAWELAEYLSTVAQQEKLYDLTGDLPARRSAWQDPAIVSNEHVRAFREQLEHVKPTPKVPEWERIAWEMQYAAERVVLAHAPVDAMLEKLNQTTDDILAKRRSLVGTGAEK
ncbi:MAG: sugar ABC transporter substrate-binding protein [Rudaea sp.]